MTDKNNYSIASSSKIEEILYNCNNDAKQMRANAARARIAARQQAERTRQQAERVRKQAERVRKQKEKTSWTS